MGKAGLGAPRCNFASQNTIISDRSCQIRRKRTFESFLGTSTAGSHSLSLRRCPSLPGCRSRFREEVGQHRRGINERFLEKSSPPPKYQSGRVVLTNSENAKQLHAVARASFCRSAARKALHSRPLDQTRRSLGMVSRAAP